MMRMILLLAALMVTGCSEAPPSIEPEPGKGAYMGQDLGEVGNNRAYKFCDEGRAIYVIDEVHTVATAVVVDAKECSRPQ